MNEEWVESQLFDIAYDVIDFCRNEIPILLNHRNSLNELVNIMKNHIQIKCPFEIKNDEISDDEYFDDGTIYEK